MHPLNILKHQDIREKAVQNRKRLQDEGYEVVRMQECVWKKMKKNPRIASFLASLRTVTPKRQLLFQKILEGIQDESLFRFVIVDIFTPDEKKTEYDEIVKNVFVGREDVGCCMKQIAEEHEFLKKPKRTLISSHFGFEVLLSTDTVKFYLEKGLKITRIYEFIQFHSEKCSEKLTNQISDNRRAS